LAGFFCGPFVPIAIDLINEHTQKETQKSSFAFLAMILTLTPVLGACFGGVVAYEYQWRLVFFLQLPLLALLFVFLYPHRTSLPKAFPSFDRSGFCLYLLSIGSFVTMITLGEQLDWFRSLRICCLGVLFIISFPLFCLVQVNKKEPYLDLRLCKIPLFALSLLSLLILFSAYFGMVILLTMWLHIDVNYTPGWIAIIILGMAFAGGLLFLVLIKWLRETTSFGLILLSVFFFACSCFYSTQFNVEVNLERLAISRILAGLGLAFFLSPLLSFAMSCLPPEKKEQGIVLFHVTRLLAGALGCTVYTTLWDRRKIFFYERLGEQLTVFSKQTIQTTSQWLSLGVQETQTPALLEKALTKQSTALALADCFYLMGWILVALLILLVPVYVKKLLRTHR
jgi:DHA2 family multidrug resistance protein